MIDVYRTTIDISADPERVFEYFVVPELLVRWMGTFARLDPSSGGVFSVDVNGVPVRGHYVRVDRPRMIELAWGEAHNDALPPGSSRVVVRLGANGRGTTVELEHSGLTVEEAKKQAIRWPHLMTRLAVAGAGGDPGPDPWADASPA